MIFNKMKSLVTPILLSLLLFVLGFGVLRFSWQERKVYTKDFNFTAWEAKDLRAFPEAQYAHGVKAWHSNDAGAAVEFFRTAIAKNPLYVAAWLKLAQAEASTGNREKAREILSFTSRLTDRVLKWKWPQALLANELGMGDIFLRNLNHLISQGKEIQNAFQLLDIHAGGSVSAMIHLLDQDNLPAYLQWLIRWDRDREALLVWPEIEKAGDGGQELLSKFVHFLVSKKHLVEAHRIWREHTGSDGMTNPDFEKEITQRGFDWRYQNDDKQRRWDIRRVIISGYMGSHSLRITFRGVENLSFWHLYQIVPVAPLIPHQLTFRWKSEGITTDQGPYVEVYGYDQRGLQANGSMMTGNQAWVREEIDFIPPEGCHAVVVRLRRLPSKRFDSKIEGTLWLDDFRLEPLARVLHD
jgi:hypothetical protein